MPVENIVFSTVIDTTTSPVCTFTNLNIMVTISCRYCLFACTPKILAPSPPDFVLLSYPTIPPVIYAPANNSGGKGSAASPFICCLVDLINFLSCNKLGRLVLSTTLNHYHRLRLVML